MFIALFLVLGRASGPVLTSLFLFVPDHSATSSHDRPLLLSLPQDEKHARLETTYHNEPALDLTGCEVEPASNYTKKKNVFRLK